MIENKIETGLKNRDRGYYQEAEFFLIKRKSGYQFCHTFDIIIANRNNRRRMERSNKRKYKKKTAFLLFIS